MKPPTPFKPPMTYGQIPVLYGEGMDDARAQALLTQHHPILQRVEKAVRDNGCRLSLMGLARDGSVSFTFVEDTLLVRANARAERLVELVKKARDALGDSRLPGGERLAEEIDEVLQDE